MIPGAQTNMITKKDIYRLLPKEPITFFMLFLLFVMISCKPAIIKKIVDDPTDPVLTANHSFTRDNYQQAVLADSLKIIETESLRGLPFHTMLDFSGKIIFTTHNGFLYFIDQDNFDDIRKTELADGITAAPSINNMILFAAVSKGKKGLLAYDMLEGDIIWSKPGRMSQSSPVIYNDLVIHASLDGKIAAFNILSGESLWENQQGDKIVNSMALLGKSLILSTQNGTVRSYNPENGSLNWSVNLEKAVYASPVIDQKNVYIASYDGSVFKIDLMSGNRKGSVHFYREVLSTPAADSSRIYLAQADGTLTAINKDNLKKSWSIRLEGPFSCSPLVTSKEIIAGTAANLFYRINKSNGIIKQVIILDGRLRCQPMIYKDQVYIGYEPDMIAVLAAKDLSDE